MALVVALVARATAAPAAAQTAAPDAPQRRPPLADIEPVLRGPSVDMLARPCTNAASCAWAW